MDNRPSAVFPLCAYIKRDGDQCASPAMKGLNFCFQHIGGTTSSLLRARSTRFNHSDLEFAYPADRESLQHNLFLVAWALKEGRIDVSIANTYNRLFRTCEQNLHRWEKLQKQKKDHPESELPRMSPLSDADQSENAGAPCLEETREQAPEQHDDGGAPSFRAVDRGPREQVFVHGMHERVGDDESQPSDNAGAPRLEETWVQESNQQDDVPTEPASALSEEQPTDATPTFDILTVDYKKYDPRFKELERLYSSEPDYIDRLRAAIRQIHEEEEQAWRAAGCPSLKTDC
jgi:hypothetical protein